jgi:Hemopexin.
MVWGYNSKTYLFSGTRYWKLDDETGRSEPDYPRNMTENWRGVGVDIDDAFQWKDGKSKR